MLSRQYFQAKKEHLDIIDQLLEIQEKQLAEWKSKLSTECYNALIEYVNEANNQFDDRDDPYNSIIRGNSLTVFISNWKPEQK